MSVYGVASERVRRSKRVFHRLDSLTRFRLRLGRRADDAWASQILQRPGNILDIGCGRRCRVGEGTTPYGIELSVELARDADRIYRNHGGKVINAPALLGLDGFDDGFFTAIMMRSYLEHEAHPRHVLAKVHSKLGPDGIALVKVPDFGCIGRRVMRANWCGFRFPDHMNYFTERTLRFLAIANGFRFKRQSLIPGFNDNIYALLTRVQLEKAADPEFR